MPSKIVTAHTTTVSVAARRKNARHIITSLTINNHGGSADRTIRIQDIFTPDASNGVASPSEQTVDRLRVNIAMGDMITWNEGDLKGIECLGAVKVIGDAIDASCYVTVGYRAE
ncbi:hypothetical protein LCGC14_0782040 [marine sediment metagenome]|uniref:Uncharacterized protein n=1 Tax=marine sediment metagenome TaxID=412755 RepID=A0A0F9PZG0_9ZZZZ